MLILDNFSGHPRNGSVEYEDLLFLPPNTTLLTELIVQGSSQRERPSPKILGEEVIDLL